MVEGEFKAGDTIKINSESGREIARGIVNYDVEEIEKIKGAPTHQLEAILGHKCYDEIIHRDHLVILTGFESKGGELHDMED